MAGHMKFRHVFLGVMEHSTKLLLLRYVQDLAQSNKKNLFDIISPAKQAASLKSPPSQLTGF